MWRSRRFTKLFKASCRWLIRFIVEIRGLRSYQTPGKCVGVREFLANKVILSIVYLIVIGSHRFHFVVPLSGSRFNKSVILLKYSRTTHTPTTPTHSTSHFIISIMPFLTHFDGSIYGLSLAVYPRSLWIESSAADHHLVTTQQTKSNLDSVLFAVLEIYSINNNYICPS